MVRGSVGVGVGSRDDRRGRTALSFGELYRKVHRRLELGAALCIPAYAPSRP